MMRALSTNGANMSSLRWIQCQGWHTLAVKVATKGHSTTQVASTTYILLQPASWPLFGVHWDGVDYVWSVLPFGWNESPFVYHPLSDAKAGYLRSKGNPALSYIDDSWLANPRFTHGEEPRVQWLAAAEAIHVAVLVSFSCGYYLSENKCVFKPTQVQRCLGIICDSREAVFRIPTGKLLKLQDLLRSALDGGSLDVGTLERIAGKCMSMPVAIRPASLWTHSMFATIARLSRARKTRISLSDHGELRAELQQWLSLS